MPAAVEAGDIVSFTVWIPHWALDETLPPPRLRMGGHIVDLIPTLEAGGGTTFVSPRLVSRQPAPNARLNRHRLSSAGGEIRLVLWRWRPQNRGEQTQGLVERSSTIRQPASSSTSSSLLRTTSE